jgi:MFS family permease
MGVTQNKGGFFAVRFILGITESGLFPGVVYYLSMWYKREERQYRISLFFSAASLAGAFGGILAYVRGPFWPVKGLSNKIQGIAFMKGVGGLNGWRWIFMLEGILTVVVSVSSYYFIANYPSTAKFITENERSYIQARLKANSDSTRDEVFTWHNFTTALKDYKVWLYGLGFHTMSLKVQKPRNEWNLSCSAVSR